MTGLSVASFRERRVTRPIRIGLPGTGSQSTSIMVRTASIMVRTANGFCWAALANSREASAETGGALDNMMWDLVRQVKSWKA